jgi:hypothetical protein
VEVFDNVRAVVRQQAKIVDEGIVSPTAVNGMVAIADVDGIGACGAVDG